MPRRPTLKCRTNRVLCPDPTCRRQQSSPIGVREPGRFRGRGVSRCSCGQEYVWHAADGVVEVVGLWPQEADRIDIDEPLPAIWERLGLMAGAA